MRERRPRSPDNPSEWVNRAGMIILLAKLEEELRATESTMRALLELSEKREHMRHKIGLIRAALSGPSERIRLTSLQ